MAGPCYQDIVVIKEGEVECELCNVTIPDNDYFIEDHFHNSDHAKKYKIRLLMQNGILITEDKLDGKEMIVAQGECSICDSIFDAKNLVNHIEIKTHLNKIDSIKEVATKDGGFMVLPENITKFGRSVNCLICDCAIKFNLEVVKSHISTDRHKKMRSIAVQPLNSIFCVENNNEYLWCKICQIGFQNYVELILQHVDEDTKHLTELRKLFLLIKDQSICIKKFLQDPRQNGGYCKRCDTEIPCNLDNLERHIRGKQHNPSKP